MTNIRFAFFILISLAAVAVVGTDLCDCLNGGRCSPQNHCVCPLGFIGQKCQVEAQPLQEEPIQASLTSNFSYFYFQPTEINYYKLTFNICMLHNPSLLPSIFYIETQKSNGSLRSVQSLFETAKLVLGEKGCTSFSTHYISIKRREDENYRKIVVGMRVMEKDDPSHYLNTYRSPQKLKKTSQTNQKTVENPSPAEFVYQSITVGMKYEKYMQTTYYGNFILMSTASLLLIIFGAFINYLRNRYRIQLEDRLTQFQEFSVPRLQHRRDNPERAEREERRRKNQLDCIEVFMPITKFGEMSCFFVDETLSNCLQNLDNEGAAECCSICLNNFQKDEEVRTTPCKHQYHRECIDNWCSSNLSCPICRRPLDFKREIRKIYFQFLRSKQTR